MSFFCPPDLDAETSYKDGIAAAFTLTLLNYLLLGFAFPVDGYYMRSWEMWLAITVVFTGAGNIGITILDYRLYGKDLVCSMTKKALRLLIIHSATRSLVES